MTLRLPHRGMNLRDLVALLREAGGDAHEPHRTGELRLTHPALGRHCTINGRRKDASHAAVAFVKEAVLAARENPAGAEPKLHKRRQAYRKDR